MFNFATRRKLTLNTTMAINNKKISKMGSMMGIDLNSVTAAPPVETTPPAPAEEPAPAPAAAVATPEPPAPSASDNKPSGFGRPKFVLIEGAEEKKINLDFPEILWDEICTVARKEKKSAKQFISEILYREMTTKYGFKVNN